MSLVSVLSRLKLTGNCPTRFWGVMPLRSCVPFARLLRQSNWAAMAQSVNGTQPEQPMRCLTPLTTIPPHTGDALADPQKQDHNLPKGEHRLPDNTIIPTTVAIPNLQKRLGPDGPIPQAEGQQASRQAGQTSPTSAQTTPVGFEPTRGAPA